MTSIYRNSFFLLSSKVTGFALAFIMSIFISRQLGPWNRGVYFLVIALSSFMTIFLAMGMNVANVYFLSKAKAKVEELNGNALIFSFVAAVIPLALFVLLKGLAVKLIPNIAPHYIMLVLLVLPFSLYSFLWRGLMSGMNKVVTTSVVDILNLIFNSAVLAGLLFYSPHKVRHIVIFWAASQAGFAVIRYVLVCKASSFRVCADLRLFRKVFSYGFKCHIGNIAYFTYHSIDTFIVNLLVGAAGVGFYTLSVQIAEKTWLVPTAINEGAIPYIGREKKGKSVVVNKLSRHGLMLSTLFSVILFVTAPLIIKFVYGSEYLPSLIPLWILLPGTVFLLLAGIFSSYFSYKTGEPSVPSAVSWLNLMVYIPLAYYSINHFGIIGAAAASTISYFFTFLSIFALYLHSSRSSLREVLVPQRQDIAAYFKILNKLPFLERFRMRAV